MVAITICVRDVLLGTRAWDALCEEVMDVTQSSKLRGSFYIC